MGFRFSKRIKIAPGVSVNLSKSGVSTTLGPKGAKLNVSAGRKPRATVGIPGTGISYSQSLTGESPPPQQRAAAPQRPFGSRTFLVLIAILALTAVGMVFVPGVVP